MKRLFFPYKILILISLVLFTISLFLPFEIWTYSGTQKILYIGSVYIIFGGWPGIILIIISLLKINAYRFKIYFRIGIIGCCLLGFNLIFILFAKLSILGYVLTYGYYLMLISWMMFCVFFYGIYKKSKDVSIYLNEFNFSPSFNQERNNIIRLTNRNFKDIMKTEFNVDNYKKQKSQLIELITFKFSNINKLILSSNFSSAFRQLIKLKVICDRLKLMNLVEAINNKLIVLEKIIIQDTIVKMINRFSELKIKEISEKSGIEDESKISDIIIDMINMQLIKGEYNQTSRTLKINEDLIHQEIDDLLRTFEKWEESKFDKEA